MNIAYCEYSNSHGEIFGTFLEYCIVNNHQITVYNDKEVSGSFDYFKTFRHFDTFKLSQFANDYKQYDVIFMSILGDTNFDNLDKTTLKTKCILICHLNEDLKRPCVKLFKDVLVLTPFNGEKYLLPIHNLIKYSPIDFGTNMLTVGRIKKDENRDSDHLVWMADHFKITHITRMEKFVPNKIRDRIKLILKCKTNDMGKHILKNNYLLTICKRGGWYHKDRLTGMIPIMYNYCIPVITDNIVKKQYDLGDICISYENHPHEIIPYVKEIKAEEYENMRLKIHEKKMEIIKFNHKLLDSYVI